MDTIDKPNSQFLVVDGDAAIVMRILRNHTILSYDRLKFLAIHQLETDDSFEPVINFIKKHKWMDESNEGARLTEAGEQWLARQGGELDVEVEDFGGLVPKKPYDVAKLKMETKNVSVFQALRKIEKEEIVLNPDFQRAFVWDLTKQSQLIESILIRIPLPAFYLDATDQVSWNVVDGLQRLTTLYRYCRKQGFALSNLQFLTELNNLKFDQLPKQYKVLIEDETQLLFYNLMPGTPVEAKFTIFSRVNTGGLQLTPQEIRHALCQGKVTLLLGQMAKSNKFRIATEGVVESLRMGDRELILRVLAFMHLGVEKYKDFTGLDGFLLHAMAQLNTLTDDNLKELETDFYDSLDKVRSIFGKYAFRKFYAINGRRSPLNKALFEVWVVCVRGYEKDALVANKSKIIETFMDKIDPYSISGISSGFIRSISASTGNYSAVLTRFSTIKNLLKSVLER